MEESGAAPWGGTIQGELGGIWGYVGWGDMVWGGRGSPWEGLVPIWGGGIWDPREDLGPQGG